MIRPLFKAFIILFTAALFLWISGFALFNAQIHKLQPESPTHKTDAIIVLTGGPERINTGLDLLTENAAQHLFISGVDDRVSAEKLIKMWQPEKAVVQIPCCITLGHEAHNTTQNAQESAVWVKKENLQSLRLVTASYHMPRAYIEFHAALPDKEIFRHPIITQAPAISRESYRRLLFSEYNKTILTKLRVTLRK